MLSWLADAVVAVWEIGCNSQWELSPDCPSSLRVLLSSLRYLLQFAQRAGEFAAPSDARFGRLLCGLPAPRSSVKRGAAYRRLALVLHASLRLRHRESRRVAGGR